MLASLISKKKKKSLFFEASLRDLKSGGVGGGAAPPICKHNPRIMAFDTRVCVEASGCDLKKKPRSQEAKKLKAEESQEAKKPRRQQAKKAGSQEFHSENVPKLRALAPRDACRVRGSSIVL